jgi:hypothetical protein
MLTYLVIQSWLFKHMPQIVKVSKSSVLISTGLIANCGLTLPDSPWIWGLVVIFCYLGTVRVTQADQKCLRIVVLYINVGSSLLSPPGRQSLCKWVHSNRYNIYLFLSDIRYELLSTQEKTQNVYPHQYVLSPRNEIAGSASHPLSTFHVWIRKH